MLREDGYPQGQYARLRAQARDHGAAGRYSFAHERARRAIALARRRARSAPDEVSAQRELAEGYRTLGWICDMNEDSTGAVAAYAKALAVQRIVAASSPDLSERELGMIFVLRSLGYAYSHTKQRDTARACWKETLARIADAPDREKIIDAEPSFTTDLHETIAHSYRHEGKVAPAVASFRRALSAAEEVARRGIQDPQERRESGDTIGWAGVQACRFAVELLADTRRLQQPKHQRVARSIIQRARRLLVTARARELLGADDAERGAERIRESEARCDEASGGA